jgi:hypothetical protein
MKKEEAELREELTVFLNKVAYEAEHVQEGSLKPGHVITFCELMQYYINTIREIGEKLEI